jgi:hypothetical protein
MSPIHLFSECLECDSILTARYSHRSLHDFAGTIELLPRFLPDQAQTEPLKAAGTEGKNVVPHVAQHVVPPHIPLQRGRIV